MTHKLFVVENEPAIRDMLKFVLHSQGFEVDCFDEVKSAQVALKKEKPDLILLDWMMPGTSGIEYAKILKQQPATQNIPVIMLTAKAEEENKILGLDVGADDYITKPFSLGEFLARVRAALRRKPKSLSGEQQLEAGDLSLDLIGRRAYQDRQELNLSHKEFDLLAELIRNQGMVLSRDLLLTKVWGYDYVGESRTVDVHVRWLRAKIEDDPSNPKRITTVRSIGYRFENQA